MVIRLISITAVFITSLTFSDTVVGKSDSFSFPDGIGILDKDTPIKSFKDFQSRLMKNGYVYFSWSMKAEAETGTIAIYSLAGKLIKTVKIVPRKGFATWNVKESGVSNGIYFAVMKVGVFKRIIKFSIL